jgi:hypothetical protein
MPFNWLSEITRQRIKLNSNIEKKNSLRLSYDSWIRQKVWIGTKSINKVCVESNFASNGVDIILLFISKLLKYYRFI